MSMYYEFHNPVNLISGYGIIPNSIGATLKALNSKRVLLISDRENNSDGTVDIVRKSIIAGGVNVGGVYLNVPRDSSVLVISKIANLCMINSCDSIVAVGAGSVLDTAKCVRLIISQNTNHITDLKGFDMCNRGVDMPLVLVPATCGTGSEVSNVAVVLDETGTNKLDFVTEELLPNATIIDGSMLVFQSPMEILSAAFDALTHAIESVTGRQRNPISTKYACMAIMMIRDNLEYCLCDNPKEEHLHKLMEASTIAGVAQSSSMLGVVHAICYSLGVVLEIWHRECTAEVLPHVLKYDFECCKDLYAEMFFYLVPESVYVSTPKEDRAKVFCEYIQSWYKRLHALVGGSNTIVNLGLSEQNVDAVAKTASRDGLNIINPRYIDLHGIKEILLSIMRGDI